MKPPKKDPPPDDLGNVQGRLFALKASATQQARVEQREGGDYAKALGKALKEREPEFRKLNKRLALLNKKQPKTAKADSQQDINADFLEALRSLTK